MSVTARLAHALTNALRLLATENESVTTYSYVMAVTLPFSAALLSTTFYLIFGEFWS